MGWKKNFSHAVKIFLPGTRRRGMGLPMAISVVLIGTALITFIFYAVTQFQTQSLRQSLTYDDHAHAADFVQMVKGLISDHNARQASLSTPGPALHRPTREREPPFPDGTPGPIRPNTVNSARDLQIIEIPATPGSAARSLSLDVAIPGVRQAARVRVYDVAYSTRDLHGSFRVDPDPRAWNSPLKNPSDMTEAQRLALAEMPAPVVLSNRIVSGDVQEFMTSETTWDDNRENNDDEFPEMPPDLFSDQWGAYVVRVELFDTSVTPRRRIRFLEEAFFQLASRDAP